MNVIIISGRIVSEIEFRFIYNKDKKEKHTAIAIGKLELDNGSIVDIYGYDEIADILYSNNSKYIYVDGILHNNMQIEVVSVQISSLYFGYKKVNLPMRMQ